MAVPPRALDAAPASRGGVLVVDKPAGPTSHDVVAVVRRAFRGAKVGHTGTLDPFATGVLPVVIGRATRLARYLGGSDKEYDALIRLGRTTDTCDATGAVVAEAPAGFPIPTQEMLSGVLGTFLGRSLQTPPAFSAKLVGGVRAYDQARRGAPVDLPPAQVDVRELELVSCDGPLVRIRVVSSAGFYVRALARDIGERLGIGATLEGLRRLRSGTFTLDDAVTLDAVVRSEAGARLIPLDSLLGDWPAASLTAGGAEWVSHGRPVGPAECVRAPGVPAGTRIRFMGPANTLLAVGETGAGGVLHPTVVLV